MNTDGAGPNSIVMDGSGNLFGTTIGGGAGQGQGTVFELSPPSSPGGAWIESVLYLFYANGQSRPYGGVILGPNGSLYGTVYFGWKLCAHTPKRSCGGIFQLTPPATPGNYWQETVLYKFTGKGNGGNPSGGLTMGQGGLLYGTTYYTGGWETNGTVFALQP